MNETAELIVELAFVAALVAILWFIIRKPLKKDDDSQPGDWGG